MIKIKRHHLIFISLLLYLLVSRKKNFQKQVSAKNKKDSKDTKKIRKKFRRKLRIKSKSGKPLDLDDLNFNVEIN